MTTPYFDALSERLRGSGLPEDEVAGTIDDLTAYVAESGADPEEEFGPVEEFAARLAPGDGPGPDVPGPSAGTWVWRADAFNERAMLDRFGDEGWEVERVDPLGRFVSHRDPESPQRWEYRRESVLPGRRKATAARLAPDGWESCGTWMHFEYFKRPKAASLGPEAALPEPPRTPARRVFLSRRFRVFIACYALFVLAVCAGSMVFADGRTQVKFLVGFLLGAVIAAVLAVARMWQDNR
ncbi:hypothetical protein [Actinomadura fibrosa]|uniref:DUF2812 domain-containing protein n=1 Tax=Actinomadura fibrosa TaxID=111802 RepID=A0ABW2Y245_9ACTN|nr:hypothetical protein [Actinomadura fibrosa]